MSPADSWRRAQPVADLPERPCGLPHTETDDLTRLHARLERAADAEGVLDVAFRLVDTPGRAAAVGRHRSRPDPHRYEREDFDRILDLLADRVGPRILRHRPSGPGRRQLDEYFTGGRTAFDLPPDFRLSAGFRQVVRQYLPHIGYGHTATYRQVATQVGNPRALRAVGTACATNPLPVVVPCHRVLRSDGSLGPYVGDPDAKNTLLTIERTAA